MALASDASVAAELTLVECEALLEQTPVGRLGFVIADQPLVLPVNFRYFDGNIVFQTFPGQKFDVAKTHQRVAFEVDDWDEELRSGWSVLVKGRAEEIVEWSQARAADNLDLEPWIDNGLHGPWVRVVPSKITGRRIGWMGT